MVLTSGLELTNGAGILNHWSPMLRDTARNWGWVPLVRGWPYHNDTIAERMRSRSWWGWHRLACTSRRQMLDIRLASYLMVWVMAFA